MRQGNELAKALEQQGFHFENVHQTAQIAWQEREREVLTSLCRKLGIDAQHNQGLSDDRKHLSKSEYIKEKEMLQEQINEELQPLKDELTKYREFQISENNYSINAKKLLFQQKVSIPISDFEQIQEQAKGYRLMKDDISQKRKELDKEIEKQREITQQLNAEKEKLEEERQNFKEREYNLHQNELILEEREAEWVEDVKELHREQTKQREVNELLRQSERKVAELEKRKSNLIQETREKEKMITQLKKQLKTEREKIISECEMSFSSEKEKLKLNLQEYAIMQEK